MMTRLAWMACAALGLAGWGSAGWGAAGGEQGAGLRGGPVAGKAVEGAVLEDGVLYPEVESFLRARAAEFGEISAERRAKLEAISSFVSSGLGSGEPVRLVFVCTHNSRRSQMSQLWASAAARFSGFEVTVYSGGTEDTAFNPRAVAAMRRAGFRIEQTTEDRNPVYHARMAAAVPAATCFSKAYFQPPNPKDGFAAVMVCDDADEACPVVAGAEDRFSLPFVDPKVSDGTVAESSTYDERCAQIAREMLYVMSRVER
ncbi:MAG: protein-tyrosine-phosphatase [Planctomycetota bacterium]